MVNFYLLRIHNEEITLDEVPNLWRKKVESKLKAAE